MTESNRNKYFIILCLNGQVADTIGNNRAITHLLLDYVLYVINIITISMLK